MGRVAGPWAHPRPRAGALGQDLEGSRWACPASGLAPWASDTGTGGRGGRGGGCFCLRAESWAFWAPETAVGGGEKKKVGVSSYEEETKGTGRGPLQRRGFWGRTELRDWGTGMHQRVPQVPRGTGPFSTLARQKAPTRPAPPAWRGVRAVVIPRPPWSGRRGEVASEGDDARRACGPAPAHGKCPRGTHRWRYRFCHHGWEARPARPRGSFRAEAVRARAGSRLPGRGARMPEAGEGEVRSPPGSGLRLRAELPASPAGSPSRCPGFPAALGAG